jgi:cell division protein FtsL
MELEKELRELKKELADEKKTNAKLREEICNLKRNQREQTLCGQGGEGD